MNIYYSFIYELSLFLLASKASLFSRLSIYEDLCRVRFLTVHQSSLYRDLHNTPSPFLFLFFCLPIREYKKFLEKRWN